MSISRSEILREKKKRKGNEVENKNTKCPIDAHCHRHCRREPRIKKNCIRATTQRRTSFGF